ncbi:bifunctional metallophosphatase/5'-nucleotidase [Candidatus Epulonipiscium viviparus]|uniref:bifunctional metallophosphatase/5'-nucleotidase n=1 Tax=Candidatus Epulonipiscium viviparus TaxID=420336 RepID=UPI0027380F2E|nr:5'-nucleotidase C-terminal domain-containing protein [Candidatus Epulopiscium viviparus]
MKKRLTLGLMMTTLMLGITGCANENNVVQSSANVDNITKVEKPKPTVKTGSKTTIKEEIGASEEEQGTEIAIIHTNDIHCAIEKNMGYAGVSAFKNEMNTLYGEENVVLVDAGDAIQGGPIGKLTQGEAIVNIMNEVGYDVFVLGNHEFDYQIPRLLELMDKMEAAVISSNFIDIEKDMPVFKAYTMTTHGDTNIAYVGATTPETFTKSTPAYFQNEKGEYIYDLSEGKNGQELYDRVQSAVDEAIKAGADYIVALVHLGIDKGSAPWRSTDLITNTTGIDIVIDGHSHSVIYGETVKNAIGEEVILTQAGTKFDAIGKIIIDTATDEIEATVIPNYDKKDERIQNFIAGINEEFDELLNQVVATSSVHLATIDPKTKMRIIRNNETNLGDLVTDAYRSILETDIALVNAGGIRADIEAGEITNEEIINVHPWGNAAVEVEVTGQTILDALEMGAKNMPDESGGFLHVSGLTYSIDTTIPSAVTVNDKGEFLSVDGAYRVKDVFIGGEPLNLNKLYSVASHNYMLLLYGDGMTMFKDANVIREDVMVDNEVLINYITNNLGGNIVDEYSEIYGEGRIKIITEANKNDQSINKTADVIALESANIESPELVILTDEVTNIAALELLEEDGALAEEAEDFVALESANIESPELVILTDEVADVVALELLEEDGALAEESANVVALESAEIEVLTTEELVLLTDEVAPVAEEAANVVALESANIESPELVILTDEVTNIAALELLEEDGALAEEAEDFVALESANIESPELVILTDEVADVVALELLEEDGALAEESANVVALESAEIEVPVTTEELVLLQMKWHR